MLRSAPDKVTLLGCFWLAFFLSVSSAAAQMKILRPLENLIIETGGAAVSLTIKGRKKTVISVAVKQNGVDVNAQLFSPQGLLIAESDHPFSAQETERIFAIADIDGDYRLVITPKFSDEKGSTNIKLNELKTAAPNDLKCAEAERLFSQAQTLRTTGKTADRKKAAEIYQQSLLVRQDLSDEHGKLRTLAVLSYLSRLLMNYQKSEELSRQILQYPNEPEYLPYKADALYQIGQIQFITGKIEQAVATLKLSLSLFSASSPQQANIYTALGNYYQTIYEFELAEKAFNDALDNIRHFPDIYNEAQTRYTFGLFYITLKDYDSAIINFKRAADLREKFGNRRGQAAALSLLGSCLWQTKRFSESIEILQKVLPISQELGDVETQADIFVFLAVNYRDMGNTAKAVELLDQALSLFPDKTTTNLNTTYITLGTTQTQICNFTGARGSFERALLGYRKIGDIDGETRTLYQFAKLEFAENNLDAAKINIENALTKHEYAQAKYNNVANLSSLLEIRRGYFDLYIDILMRLDKERPNENYAFKALQISESARMRTLIWQYREAVKNTPQTADFQIISAMQKTRRQIGEQLGLLAKAQSRVNQSGEISEIEKKISSLNKHDESLKAQLRQSNPNIANLASPPNLSLANMQSELDDETVLVEYSLGEHNSYLWIVGKNSFQSFTLPKRAEIETQARNYYETLTQTADFPDNRQSDRRAKASKIKSVKKRDATEEVEKLSSLLLVKKFANLSAKRLVFAADGALNLIPFASLTYFDMDIKKQYFLSERFETAQLPSLTTLHILRQSGIKSFAPQSLAIIADPVFSPDDARLAKNKRRKNKENFVSTELSATLRDFNLTTLSRLPFTRMEAQKIAENAPENTSLNLDFKADRERLLNGDFNRFDILHFATHGFLNNKHPELSGLVLSLVDEKGASQNGFLRTQDLYLLKLKPQIVVLSACQTGLGKQIENEGLIGLTRGFLANGTPRIIAALWKVDDAATAELMSRFYRAMLKEKQLPSTALKTAQNELKAIPRFSHPRYWAGFVLTGEWR